MRFVLTALAPSSARALARCGRRCRIALGIATVSEVILTLSGQPAGVPVVEAEPLGTCVRRQEQLPTVA